mmetsp:Transcript_26475/g.69953  ORF Transcript_26475/g.69953 Transcript_26475/m.69953 type:complete len:221 (+) Transcript_26475:362-1024(+)
MWASPGGHPMARCLQHQSFFRLLHPLTTLAASAPPQSYTSSIATDTGLPTVPFAPPGRLGRLGRLKLKCRECQRSEGRRFKSHFPAAVPSLSWPSRSSRAPLARSTSRCAAACGASSRTRSAAATATLKALTARFWGDDPAGGPLSISKLPLPSPTYSYVDSSSYWPFLGPEYDQVVFCWRPWSSRQTPPTPAAPGPRGPPPRGGSRQSAAPGGAARAGT